MLRWPTDTNCQLSLIWKTLCPHSSAVLDKLAQKYWSFKLIRWDETSLSCFFLHTNLFYQSAELWVSLAMTLNSLNLQWTILHILHTFASGNGGIWGASPLPFIHPPSCVGWRQAFCLAHTPLSPLSLSLLGAFGALVISRFEFICAPLPRFSRF